ncbi:cupin domain-containing protein [Novosphingobium sp. EMRT-2]|uniref:cupin domain-containing protein n=1 Tax=Novosphingobium sp. EMRT-2 TaxID=2571749 RepID=UPI0010BD2C3F|nr:cupin domain-containing protein [Novosphingobium sp. EMRT-2]QCI92385.1 hypothetical protein FA702_01580 [Novosphingobium sp. EMRT-2]
MTRDELALEFVMGALSPLEREAVAQDRLSDPKLDEAIRTLEGSLAPMTGLAGTLTPSAGLFDRIAGAIAEERAALAGKTAAACEEGEWQPFLPGIEIKSLWNQGTVMLRCEPGSVLPAHPHAQTEHVVVISGDFVVGGRTFRTGDWHSSPAGNDHGEARTEGGCLLLIQYAA